MEPPGRGQPPVARSATAAGTAGWSGSTSSDATPTRSSGPQCRRAVPAARRRAPLRLAPRRRRPRRARVRAHRPRRPQVTLGRRPAAGEPGYLDARRIRRGRRPCRLDEAGRRRQSARVRRSYPSCTRTWGRSDLATSHESWPLRLDSDDVLRRAGCRALLRYASDRRCCGRACSRPRPASTRAAPNTVRAPRFVRQIDTGETGWFSSPGLVDLTGDRRLEIVAPFYSTFVFNANGRRLGKGRRARAGSTRLR